MYIGYPNLTRLWFILSGYQHALHEDGYQDDFLNGFNEWVAKKYEIQSSHNWAEIILFFSNGEEDAFNKFFELHDDFMNQGGHV